jgi:hypothetical protein
VPHFTVNIALVRGSTPVMGVVCTPAAATMHFAVKGKGAFVRCARLLCTYIEYIMYVAAWNSNTAESFENVVVLEVVLVVVPRQSNQLGADASRPTDFHPLGRECPGHAFRAPKTLFTHASKCIIRFSVHQCSPPTRGYARLMKSVRYKPRLPHRPGSRRSLDHHVEQQNCRLTHLPERLHGQRRPRVNVGDVCGPPWRPLVRDKRLGAAPGCSSDSQTSSTCSLRMPYGTTASVVDVLPQHVMLTAPSMQDSDQR